MPPAKSRVPTWVSMPGFMPRASCERPGNIPDECLRMQFSDCGFERRNVTDVWAGRGELRNNYVELLAGYSAPSQEQHDTACDCSYQRRCNRPE
jgi:hypothetical protein